MKIMANENIPIASCKLLIENGIEVFTIAQNIPGSSDKFILDKANKDKYIIMTFDSDYGELIYKSKLPKPAGVVYFRFFPKTATEPAEILLSIIDNTDLVLENMFTVIEKDKIRQRPI